MSETVYWLLERTVFWPTSIQQEMKNKMSLCSQVTARRAGTQRHLTVNKDMGNVKRWNFKWNSSPILPESHFWSILILHLFTEKQSTCTFRMPFFPTTLFYLPQLNARSPHPVTEKEKRWFVWHNHFKAVTKCYSLADSNTVSLSHWNVSLRAIRTHRVSAFFPPSSVRRTALGCLGCHTARRNGHNHFVDADSMVTVLPSGRSQSSPRITPKNLYHP